MNHEDLSVASGADHCAEGGEGVMFADKSQDKVLSPADAINWLRYLAKCKQRLSQVSTGEKERALAFQAHVMREAARHLENLSR